MKCWNCKKSNKNKGYNYEYCSKCGLYIDDLHLKDLALIVETLEKMIERWGLTKSISFYKRRDDDGYIFKYKGIKAIINHVFRDDDITIAELNSEHVKKHGNNYSGIVKIDYINGELVPYIYLTNGKYYVVGSGKLSLNNVTSDEPSGFKTSCSNSNAQLIDEDNNLDVTIGDRVIMGDDEFYYIGRDDQGRLKLLPKYNLDENYRQNSSTSYTLAFSNNQYWRQAGSSSSSSSSYSSTEDLYSDDFEPQGNSEDIYIYRTKTEQDTSNNLKDIINNYRSHIENDIGVYVYDARLMSYEEATAIGCSSLEYGCPEYASNQIYWLGSAYNNNSVWYVNDDHRGLGYSVFVYVAGVRPVVVVSQTDIPTN